MRLLLSLKSSTAIAKAQRRGVLTTLGALALTILLATASNLPAFGQDDDDEVSRQVTVFAVIATPDDPTVDPNLKKVLPQLRKLLPNHGFRLLSVKSKRLTAGREIVCDLGDGYRSTTTLLNPADANGKVKLRCTVSLHEAPLLESKVNTPANQLFFCDKALDNGTRLLVGIGAR